MYRVSQDATKDVISAISLPAVKELVALVKEFTRQLVKSSIASRQQERAAKQGVRAWKHSQGPVCVLKMVRVWLSLNI